MSMTENPTPSFHGFGPEAFAWFAGLEADNSKTYFSAHRDTYQGEVRGALEAMLDELAAELGGRPKLFRQNRDIRFSSDKSPYKTTTYGLILERPDSLGALYAQVSAQGLFAGSGYHGLAADQLGRFREAILDDVAGTELERRIAAARAAGLETFGEALKTAPRGYPRDHPRVHLLRHKSLIAGRRLPHRAEGIPRAAALDHARATWAACAPLGAWLDTRVGPSTEPAPTRYRGRTGDRAENRS
ncbi:MAG: hypothetical protein QOF77_537 [Solirubrobacteraceae bacterium]|jgi:uncharacterized protein (TIGR02453 family)|nr:hypothetical protein [Solirubrobacteraceae bacterium]